MSIGEVVNLYKDGDIKLDPAFQRLFRWTDEQKTKFIESILLGIPIPEIFVAQKEDAKWSVVDGVQRISTILQLMGYLPNKNPLKMTSAKYLPSLEDQRWDDLPEEVQRMFKRGKFGINIILTENSIGAQYELFQRLNTGGLHLEDQEIRNCLIIMLDEDFYKKINELKEYPSFKNSLKLTSRKFDEEYHMELILRYFIAVYSESDLEGYPMSSMHMRDFLDQETIALINSRSFSLDQGTENFKKTFDYIYSMLSDEAFKKYNQEKDCFEGVFSASAFEVISTGVGYHFDTVKAMDETRFLSKVKEIYVHERFIENTVHGVRSPVRFKNLTSFAKEFFAL